MYVCKLFKKYQKYLLQFCNTDHGKAFLADNFGGKIEKSDIICKVTPDSFHIIKDFVNNKPIIQATFFPKSPYLLKFAEILIYLLILEDNKKLDIVKDVSKLGRYIYLDSNTYYPNANVETTSVDGWVARQGEGDWTTARPAATGTEAHDYETTAEIRNHYDTNGSRWVILSRAIALFDTSSLTTGAVISSATFSIYGTNEQISNIADLSLGLVTSNPASNTAIAVGDFVYTRYGTTLLSNTTFPQSTYNSAGYNDFLLNATGKTAISKTGITKYGLRTTADINDSEPSTPSNNGYWIVNFNTADNGSNKPKLVITFSLPVFSDSMSIAETLRKRTYKRNTESQSFAETMSAHFHFPKALSDSQTLTSSMAGKIYHRMSDSISIVESKTTRPKTNPLSDSITFSESIEQISVAEAYFGGMKTGWRFKIKNPSTGKFVASLNNARKRWFVQRLNQETEAGFILDADDTNCNETILNLGVNELHIYYNTTLKWSGQLVSARKIANKNDIYWEVLAKDWFSLLSKRFCGVEALRTFTTVDAGTIAWTLINEAQALANGSFGITLGTIQSSITRSPVYDKKNIAEAIKELSNLGQDGLASYGFDFEITPLKVFNVYYPYKGAIRNEIAFRYPDNCENLEAFVDTWEIINQEWGLGRHWTGVTAVISRADATSQTTYKRREAIKSYRDMSVLNVLQDMVYQDIQWMKNPSTVIKFNARVDAKTGINNYNVGDGVTIICDKFNVDEWLWVYERKIEIADNDELNVSLIVGD